MVDLKMTSDREGVTESGKSVPTGTDVEYIAHVYGGMVKVKLPDGSIDVMHPYCFAQLR
jgi:hypothetical protein